MIFLNPPFLSFSCLSFLLSIHPSLFNLPHYFFFPSILPMFFLFLVFFNCFLSLFIFLSTYILFFLPFILLFIFFFSSLFSIFPFSLSWPSPAAQFYSSVFKQKFSPHSDKSQIYPLFSGPVLAPATQPDTTSRCKCGQGSSKVFGGKLVKLSRRLLFNHA